ncbi:MAG TPA: asparagine synthase (glutamine-hydrolyzing) [Candidatus Omnitrophica bacterium]|nr:asparagine synthase (glutamine-hydrolyzing) [Candidatus Omnitrophota bacterium]
MCGICGIIDYSTNSGIGEDRIRKMCVKMQHRGPDDEGVYIDREGLVAALGHRRLSIIDLSSAGQQPMPNEDGTIWLVFNGEVYNFSSLRGELEEKGHRFKSVTDSEAIIHLYEEYGEDCVKYIRGMFAFAIWDRNQKKLLLARDRAGKKPLLYSHHNNKFCFASEFSALLASELIEKEINHNSIDSYLSYGYVPAPSSIYRNVSKLLPGHILILKDNQVTITKYWQLNYDNKINIAEDDAATEVLRLLKEAVSVRLRSDVPLGAFLSGGIDSSVVVGLMSQLSKSKVKTFSIGFEDKAYNELGYARDIAKHFNTEHNEFIVRPKALEILPLLVERYGEPYADSSCIPVYYVSQQTKQSVTVALNGDGGDEFFAGYDRYRAMLAAESYQRMPSMVRALAESFMRILPDGADQKNRLQRIKRFILAASLPVQDRYFNWMTIFNNAIKQEMYSKKMLQLTAKHNSSDSIKTCFKDAKDYLLLDQILYTDVMTYLPNDLLVKVDIASMSNSLEARSPFLDHKLMEFIVRLPVEYKIKGSIKKYILKRAVDGLIPKDNIKRKKMGFGVPVGRWFRTELKDFIIDVLLSPRSLGRGYFNPEPIKVLIKDHIEGRKDYGPQIWALLMLELWHNEFIDK